MTSAPAQPSSWTATVDGHQLHIRTATIDAVLRITAQHIIVNNLEEQFQQSGLTVTQWLLQHHPGISVEFLRNLRSTPGRISKSELLDWIDYLKHGGRCEG